jgi:hypothetical protein
VRHEREQYHLRDDYKISQGACACAPESPLAAKKVQCREYSECMDENRAGDCDCANHQRSQHRELMTLWHLS